MIRLLRGLLVFTLACAVLLGAVVVASRAFGWQAGPLYYAVALTPYVGIALLIAGAAALVLRATALAVVSLILAAIVGFWWLPVFLPGPAVEDADLQVMTVNLLYGRADPQAVVQAVRENGVDVLSVQELTTPAVRGLRAAGLERRLPYHYLRPTRDRSSAAGTGIWSRYPLSDRSHARLVLHNLAATIPAPGGPLTVFATHPIPPSPIDGNHGSEVFAGMREFLASRPGPAVAAGDFNATRDNVPLRDLEADGWVDAATASRAGFVRTWPNSGYSIPPIVAPDHILTRDGPTAVRVLIIDIPGSDHRAVVADLVG